MALDAIKWGRFQLHKILESDMETAPVIPLNFHEHASVRVYQTTIDEPAAQVAIEDFMPGEDINWTFPHDELQYCLAGAADIEVWMPPLYLDSVKARIEPGCVYYFPQAARMRLHVLNDEPCRHIAICVPNPGYPFTKAKSIGG